MVVLTILKWSTKSRVIRKYNINLNHSTGNHFCISFWTKTYFKIILIFHATRNLNGNGFFLEGFISLSISNYWYGTYYQGTMSVSFYPFIMALSNSWSLARLLYLLLFAKNIDLNFKRLASKQCSRLILLKCVANFVYRTATRASNGSKQYWEQSQKDF